MPKPPLHVYRITRARALPDAGGHTLFFKVHDLSKQGRFLDPDALPAEFGGDEGWFEVEGFRKGALRVLRQVEPPGRG